MATFTPDNENHMTQHPGAGTILRSGKMFPTIQKEKRTGSNEEGEYESAENESEISKEYRASKPEETN